LSVNKISDKGALAIATSPYLSNLKRLDLFNNQISLKGLEAILQSKTLTKLEELDIVKNKIDEESAAKLWKSHMDSCRALKESTDPNKGGLAICPS
jgi:Leucine-rich repeat (LRR) protein